MAAYPHTVLVSPDVSRDTEIPDDDDEVPDIKNTSTLGHVIVESAVLVGVSGSFTWFATGACVNATEGDVENVDVESKLTPEVDVDKSKLMYICAPENSGTPLGGSDKNSVFTFTAAAVVPDASANLTPDSLAPFDRASASVKGRNSGFCGSSSSILNTADWPTSPVRGMIAGGTDQIVFVSQCDGFEYCCIA